MKNKKNIPPRLVQKHDLEVNWLKAINFIPKKGEIIVYDIEIDENDNILELPENRTDPYLYERFKIGDGIHNVNDLPFISADIDLTDYVKNTDYADYNNYGLVKINSTYYGLMLYGDGRLGVIKANANDIDSKTSVRAIVPENLDYAVKVGLTTNTTVLTNEEKEKALTWLGVTDKIGDVEIALDSIITIQESLIGGEA